MPNLYIDGVWKSGASGATSDVINPSDATVVTTVDVADDDDVQQAIEGARCIPLQCRKSRFLKGHLQNKRAGIIRDATHHI